jgi:hypothetical protein
LLVCVVANEKVATLSREPSRKPVRIDGERKAASATTEFEESSPVSLRSSTATTFEVAWLIAWSFAKAGTPAAMVVEGAFVRQ